MPQIAELAADVFSVVRPSLDTHRQRGTCFELFALDFSLSDELVPHLAEAHRAGKFLDSHEVPVRDMVPGLVRASLEAVAGALPRSQLAPRPGSPVPRDQWDAYEKLFGRAAM